MGGNKDCCCVLFRLFSINPGFSVPSSLAVAASVYSNDMHDLDSNFPLKIAVNSHFASSPSPISILKMASPYAVSIIELSLASKKPILQFGSFTLKSGRQSPYFFNFGLFDNGPLLLTLSEAFADAIIVAYPEIGLDSAGEATPTVLFGPAYKGIPLVATIATELARRGRSIGYSYNRKEAKTHGEGGSIVGASLEKAVVLIIDDVITAGTAIRQAYEIVKACGGVVGGIVEALDREERGTGTMSTVQEVEEELKVKVTSVVKMRDIVAWLKSKGRDLEMANMEEYRKQYGISN